jgi:hypothetical protein
MWHTFALSGDEIEDGKAFKDGEGRAAISGCWKRNANHSLSVRPAKPLISYFLECLPAHQQANKESMLSGI